MARRSDHSRAELRELVLVEAHRHMEEVGFARFSAREVGKRIGYSFGTVRNAYGSLDGLLVAVNTRSFALWADSVERRLAGRPRDVVAALVDAYFSFARSNRNLWNAIYDHHLPVGTSLPEEDQRTRSRLTGAVAAVVEAMLPPARRPDAVRITRSLVATVHGHCSMELIGSYSLMGSEDAQGEALARVREILSYGEER